MLAANGKVSKCTKNKLQRSAKKLLGNMRSQQKPKDKPRNLEFDLDMDFGHLPDTQLRGTWGFCLNHVLPLRLSVSYRVGWWGVWVVAHKILETA